MSQVRRSLAETEPADDGALVPVEGPSEVGVGEELVVGSMIVEGRRMLVVVGIDVGGM